MIDEAAPSFALLDLNGAKVNLKDLKGKIVVLDFWATWCGPCKASFPAMQTMVNKFKNDPGVIFLFIDTWERGDQKLKNAAEFIAQNKYPFQVLMDNKDETVAAYKVVGIPAKFVIDADGHIRFKATGFNNNEELIQELEAMINLSKEKRNNN
jgi:peroxiredoxin